MSAGSSSPIHCFDDLCALGIGSKVTAVTVPEDAVPRYLGPQLTSVPAIGESPDHPRSPPPTPISC